MQSDPERRAVRTRSMHRPAARVSVVAALLLASGCAAGGNAASDAVPKRATKSVSSTTSTAHTTTTKDPPKPRTTTTTTTTPPAPPPLSAAAAAAAPVGRGRPSVAVRKRLRGAPTTRPAAAIHWVAKPNVFTLLPGAHARGSVLATNGDADPGTIPTPGCPELVGHPPVLLPKSLCPPAGRTRAVGAGRTTRWHWDWNATSDGTRVGTPLPPGAYTLTIGGATVAVTVT